MASVQDLGQRGTGRSPAETPLPLNGHRTPPEEELRRAAEVLAGLDRGEELILPDDAARAAYELKLADRAAYDVVMRKQAARLNAMGDAR
jgi:hypothetical protein